MGFIGLIGASIALISFIRHIKTRFSLILLVFLGIITTISGFLLIVTFALPTFEWNDRDIYRNGNDYLVVQVRETFVTSNETYPRIIRTSSPYSMIRIVESQHYLKADDDRFESDRVTYEGTTWVKIPAK